MKSLRLKPSAAIILLGMGLAMAVAYSLAYFVDEEVLFFGFFLVAAAAYWLLLRDAPFRARLVAISSPALYLLGYVYAVVTTIMRSRPLDLLHPLMLPYYAIFIAAIAIACYTLVRVRPASPHLLQIILIPGGFLFWLYGSMALLDAWL